MNQQGSQIHITALGDPPPPVEAAVYELLVAPGIPGLARPPTLAERSLLDACDEGVTTFPADVAAGLIAAQVVVPA